MVTPGLRRLLGSNSSSVSPRGPDLLACRGWQGGDGGAGCGWAVRDTDSFQEESDPFRLVPGRKGNQWKF